MNVSRSPISCSSASSDRLYNAPRTTALNISTASHGLRPAVDLRSLFGLRHTVSSTGRKSSQGTSSSIIAKLKLPPPSLYRHVRKTQLPWPSCACHPFAPLFKRFIDHAT